MPGKTRLEKHHCQTFTKHKQSGYLKLSPIPAVYME